MPASVAQEIPPYQAANASTPAKAGRNVRRRNGRKDVDMPTKLVQWRGGEKRKAAFHFLSGPACRPGGAAAASGWTENTWNWSRSLA